jgi:ketosteroid isomerase-like protein
MEDDTARIRALIERWADAVHAGDLETVLPEHAEICQRA